MSTDKVEENRKEKNQIIKEITTTQLNYVYYVIALRVTCIGFSLYQTTGKEIKNIHIVLFFGLACWGLSIHIGFRYIHGLLEMRMHDIDRFSLQPVKDALEMLKKTDKLNRVSNSQFKWQRRLFYFGVMLFFGWHVLGMICMKLNSCSYCQ